MVIEEVAKISNEVGERLEDLFGDEEAFDTSLNEKSELQDSPLRDLKAIILSIDWEITDKVMNRLIEQLSRFRKDYGEDRIILLYIQLLLSVGKYIQAYKSRAHPEAVKLLNAVYMSMEKVIITQEMTNEERKRMLSYQIARFNKLKEQVKKRKSEEEKNLKRTQTEEAKQAKLTQIQDVGASEQKIAATNMDKVTSGVVKATLPSQETIDGLLEEIKQCIRSEFESLKKEMKILRSEMQA